MDLFNGRVPPWPEALIARRAGEEVARAAGIEFWFPSPDHPEDRCPHWWQRDAEGVTRCRGCGIPLMPSDSKFVASDQCHFCWVEEKRRTELIVDAPGRSVFVSLVVVNGQDVHRIGFGKDAGPVGEMVATALRRQTPPVELSPDLDVTLSSAAAAALRDACAAAIDALLANYERRSDLPRWATYPHTVVWRGVEREIQRGMNRVGEEISSLLNVHTILDKHAQGGSVHVFGNGGVTERGLSFLIAMRGGASTVADLCAAFPFLAAEAVEGTVEKLARRGFVARQGERLELLLKGRMTDVAGP
jgi:hypothetical protein